MSVIATSFILIFTTAGLVLARDQLAADNDRNRFGPSSQVSAPEQELRRVLLNNFMKIFLQKSLLASMESEQLEETSMDELDEEASEEVANELSSAIRNVGVGYNIIYGSPDGNFKIGGIDPGILSTRVVFDFTYEERKEVFYMGQALQVPDQVNFQPHDSCTANSRVSVYSGARSYQNSLKLGASPGVALYDFRFGLSTAVGAAHRATAERRRVYMDQKQVCNTGRVEYLSDASRGIHRLSKRFQDRVGQLPVQYSMTAYMQFINDWGTHVIISADIGTKEINRSSSTYTEVYRQLKLQGSGGITFSGSYSDYGGSLDLNISALHINARNRSNFGSRVTSFRIGSVMTPFPISLQLIDISEVLHPKYWSSLEGTSRSYNSLRVETKRENLARALQDYADYVGVSDLTDPQVRLQLSWPKGMYALPAAKSGCPRGWSSGHRNQTSGENIDISTNITRQMDVRIGNVITLGYCVKETEDNDLDLGFYWPEGSYCVARRGGSCPPQARDHCIPQRGRPCPRSRFTEGRITWHDRKTLLFQRNNNSVWGRLPDGRYGRDTTIEFCCRNDGRPSDPILLPIADPFVLYRYGGTCQSVSGTTVTEHFIQFDDNSRIFNWNRCAGAHPDNASCRGRHRLHYCYYQRNK